MPRARRKAAQAKSGGVVKDFVKKKERLGKRAVRENATNTRVKSRQIYLPAGVDEDTVINSALKRGLTYQQLLARVAHYNTNVRMSALNGLSKAISISDNDDSVAASAHAKLDGINLLKISLNALQDEETTVRNSAITLLTAVVRQLKSVKPISQLLSATLMACLSHIRKDVQLVAAQAITSVFDGYYSDTNNNNNDYVHVSPAQVFGGKVSDVLVGLGNLVSAGKMLPKKKAVIINAIAAVLGRPTNTYSSSKKERSMLYGGKRQPFLYHSLENDDDGNSYNHNCNKAALDSVAKRVANVVLECLPIHETKKDKQLVALLLASVRCLHIVLSTSHGTTRLAEENNTNAINKLTDRMLKSWSKDRNRHHERGHTLVHSIHNYMGAIALTMDEWKICGDYLVNALNHAVTPIPEKQAPSGNDSNNAWNKMSVECVAEKMILLQSQSRPTGVNNMGLEKEKNRVRNAWIARWLHAFETNNMYYIANSTSIAILKSIVENAVDDGDNNMCWKVVLKLPAVVKMAAQMQAETECDDGSIWEELAQCALDALANVCRRGANRRHLQRDLAPLIETSLCDEKVLRAALGNRKRDNSKCDRHMEYQLMAVLFYSGAYSGIKMLRVVVDIVIKDKENNNNNNNMDIGVRFATALFSIVDAHFEEYKRRVNGNRRRILDLYAALSIVAEACHNNQDNNIALANECTQVANRIMVRIDGGDD